MEIFFDNRSENSGIDTLYPQLSDIILDGLRLANAPGNSEVSVSFTTPDEIRQLNNDYRNQDRETDVLSFPFYDFDEISLADIKITDAPVALGDIIICPVVAEFRAREYGHSFLQEISFLTVHGLLHLLGYSHEDPDEEEEMLKMQKIILKDIK